MMTSSFTRTVRRSATLWLACAFVALSTACGGGSDDDPAPDATPNFAGSYTGAVNKTQDSCGTTAPLTFTGTDVATQSGRNMTMNSGGTVFTGTVDADNGGFTLSNITVSGAVTANSTATFRLRPATSDYQQRTTAVTSVAGTSTACTLVYEGIMTRR